MPDAAELLAALPPRHAQLVGLVAAGSKIQSAADSIGMTREQASRLINHDGGCKAALAQLLDEAAEQSADAIRRIHGKSMAALEAAVDSGDVRALLAVIQQLGMVLPSPVIIQGGDQLADDESETMADLLDNADPESRMLWSLVTHLLDKEAQGEDGTVLREHVARVAAELSTA